MDVKFKKQFPTRKELEIVSSTRLWKRQDKAARLIQRSYRNFRRYYCPTRLTGVRGCNGPHAFTHLLPPNPRPIYSHHTPPPPPPPVPTRTRPIHPSSLSRPPGTRFPNRTVLSVLPTESASDFFSLLFSSPLPVRTWRYLLFTRSSVQRLCITCYILSLFLFRSIFSLPSKRET